MTRKLWMVPMLIGILGQGQSQPLVFEVATIKPSDPDARGSGFRFVPGGGIQVNNVPVKQLIAFTYDVRDFQISGGPAWISTARFDILAKPEGAGGPADLGKVPDKQRSEVYKQIMERLEGLLADRFQLAIHKETKELPVYKLVVGKNGPKMEESKEGDGTSQNTNQNGNNGKYTLTAKRTSMEMLATVLSRTLGRTVIDQTGLTANYNLKMEWTQDQSAKGPDAGGEKLEANLSDSTGPSIFTAIQQQLGLKLDSQKGPVEIIVIDRVEKPSEN